MVEQRIRNAWVRCSSHLSGTIFLRWRCADHRPQFATPPDPTTDFLLPDVIEYRRTPDFDQDSIPVALGRSGSTLRRPKAVAPDAFRQTP
mgnify:CR=1 FL=1